MFDPYRKWLALPPDQRPPTYYQLLGLAAGEADAEIIEEAAIRQTTHVRAYQMGPHAQECTRLLNEIALARAILMDPARRQKYDLTLAQKEKAAAKSVSPAIPAPPVEDSPREASKEGASGKRPKRKSASSRSHPLWIYLAGGIGIVAVLAVILIVALPLPGPDIKQAKEKPTPKKDKEAVVRLPKEKVDDGKKVIALPPQTKLPPIGLGPNDPSPLDGLDPAKIAASDRQAAIPELVAVAKGAKGEVFGVGFSPDSKWLGAVDNRGQLTAWDISGAEPGPAISFVPAGGPMCSVAFSPDSKQVACANGSKIRIYDLSPPAMAMEAPLNTTAYVGAAISPDGKTLAIGDNGGVHLVTLATKAVQFLTGHNGAVRSVMFTRDGSRLLTGSADGTARVWNLKAEPPEMTHVCKTASSMRFAAFSPDARSVATGEDSGRVSLWDITGLAAQLRWSKKEHRQWANSVSFAPDGKSLISTEGGGDPRGPHSLNWYRADTGDLIQQIPLPERSSHGVFAPNGLYVAVSNHNFNVYILRLNAKR